MYLFDTDHSTALDRAGEEGERLRTRLAHVPPEEAAVSVGRYEEQIQSWRWTAPTVSSVPCSGNR